MGLPRSTWNVLLQSRIGTRSNNVLGTVECEKWLIKSFQLCPRRTVEWNSGVIGCYGDQHGKFCQAFFVGRRGMRCTVSPIGCVADRFGKSGLEYEPGESRGTPHQVGPQLEKPVRAVTQRHTTVGDGHPVKALWEVGHQVQPNSAAPVLAVQGDVMQVHGD